MSNALDRTLKRIAAHQGDDVAKLSWGAEHFALIEHKVFSHVPLLSWWSGLLFPSAGDFYSLGRGGGFDTPEGQPLARTQAGGYRGVFDFANLACSRFITATGQSGHIFSAHYRDLLPLWRAGRAITLSGDENALKRGGATLMTFAPE